MQHNFKDISGQRFGNLTVGYRVPRDEYALNQIYNSYRQSSKKKNIDWNLSKKEFLNFLKSDCFYCGRKEISCFKIKDCNFKYNGIDRRENSKGYVLNNCVTCCIECNRAKNNHDTQYFDNYIQSIVLNRLQIRGKIVKKVWGTETVLVNEDLYCSKFLKINPGFQCSLHKHFTKKETFTVLEGEVILETKISEDEIIKKEILKPGDSRLIVPGTFHRFSSILGAIILETSTFHSDKDVYRLEESKKIFLGSPL